MNIPQLTPDELKTLQLFAYYCRSYGADSVYRTYYLSACRKDWEDDRWYSNDVRGGIDGYDRIDELIDKLVDDESIVNEFNDCDGSQRIDVEIDCKDLQNQSLIRPFFEEGNPKQISKFRSRCKSPLICDLFSAGCISTPFSNCLCFTLRNNTY